jgi:hypothetical protein
MVKKLVQQSTLFLILNMRILRYHYECGLSYSWLDKGIILIVLLGGFGYIIGWFLSIELNSSPREGFSYYIDFVQLIT